MGKLTFGVLIAGMAGCGAPEGDAASSWAVRLSSASPSAGQAQVIAQRIASVDPLDAAWGAYLAGDLGMTAMADSLAGLTQDGPVLRSAALDALARIGGSLPDTRLRELMTTEPMTAMAIALQEPAAHRDVIFEAFTLAHETLPRSVGDGLAGPELATWRAYANALGWLRDRAFVATLLASLEASVDVEVVSPGDTVVGFGCRCGASFGTSCRGWAIQPFMALPPSGTWSFRDADDPACVVLLPGPTDVCLARAEGYLQENMLERALAGAPLRPWVSSIGHDDALAALDDHEEGESQDSASDALEDVADDSMDDTGIEGSDELATEPPSLEAREACPADAAIADSETEDVASPLNDELLAHLSALYGESLVFHGRLSMRHVWTGEDAYRARVDSLRHQIRAAHAALGRALADTYLLPDGYRPRPPTVEVFARDARTCGATAPLPRI